MSANEWIACCDAKDQAAAGLIASSLGGSRLRVVCNADDLRREVLASKPGELGVVVCQSGTGVSEVNLAAALANDGNARCVVLALHDVSGSLRSRAARAGIDRVVDLRDFGACPDGCGASGSGRGVATDSLPAGLSVPFDDGFDEKDATLATGLARARRSVADPAHPVRKVAPVVTFCSGRGGEGKTSIVALAAATAASWGMSVCAVDLDLSCGNLAGCFGLTHGSDLAMLAEPGRSFAELAQAAVVTAPCGVGVAGPCALPEAAELAMPCTSELLMHLSQRFDLVLVDASTTFTDAVAQAAQMSDRLVLVSDGRAGSIAALARMAGLAVRLGVARTRIARIQNRTSPRERRLRTPGSADGLEGARTFCVFEGDAEVEDYLGSGEAAELVDSGSPFSESVAAMLALLLEELGCLPECESAVRAARGGSPRRRKSLFGRRAEVG